jgi:hypothetical protein
MTKDYQKIADHDHGNATSDERSADLGHECARSAP